MLLEEGVGDADGESPAARVADEEDGGCRGLRMRLMYERLVEQSVVV